jgi:hypothetical protein
MTISEYRVIESARTFTVEAWHGSGALMFERLGFPTREEAEARITRRQSQPVNPHMGTPAYSRVMERDPW